MVWPCEIKFLLLKKAQESWTVRKFETIMSDSIKVNDYICRIGKPQKLTTDDS